MICHDEDLLEGDVVESPVHWTIHTGRVCDCVLVVPLSGSEMSKDNDRIKIENNKRREV